MTPGPALRDFEAYYAAGATWRLDGDAYGREIWRVERRVPGVVASRDELLPFVGPPFALPILALLGSLDYRMAVVVWGTVLGFAALLLGVSIARLASLRDATDAAALVLLGAAFGPLTSALALGQVALIACAGVAATALLLALPHVRLAFAVITAWTAALQPNLAIALVARLSDRRAAFALGIAAVLAVAASAAAAGGVAGLARYFALLAAHANAERTVAIQLTVAAVAFGFGAPPGIASVVASVLAVAVVLATAWVLRSSRYDPAARVAVACAALPLVLPFSHEHDLTVALFPAVMCVRRAHGTWWTIVACATVAIAVDWLGLAQRPSGLWQSTALALAAASAIAALSSLRASRAIAAPLSLAVAVVAVGAAAAQHPLGVWPYALGTAFHAPDALDATQVWALEQARSGLATPNLPAALLRTLSLTGCAALWVSGLAVLRRGVR